LPFESAWFGSAAELRFARVGDAVEVGVGDGEIEDRPDAQLADHAEAAGGRVRVGDLGPSSAVTT